MEHDLTEKPWQPDEIKQNWRQDELRRLSSGIRHWEDIKSYHLSQVKVAGKEIALRYNRINEIYRTPTEPESELTASPIDYKPRGTRRFGLDTVRDRIDKLLDRTPR